MMDGGVVWRRAGVALVDRWVIDARRQFLITLLCRSSHSPSEPTSDMVRPSTHVSTRTAKRTWPPRSEGSGRKTISSLVTVPECGVGMSIGTGTEQSDAVQL